MDALSLRPSDAQAGGFLDDVDVTLRECRFVIWDYMAHTGLQRALRRGLRGPREGTGVARVRASDQSERSGDTGELGVAPGSGREGERDQSAHGELVQAGERTGSVADTADGLVPQQERGAEGRDGPRPDGALDPRRDDRTFWADCEWLPCRDGKWRPVEPGTFPLAHGVPVRLGRLRGYGNAIVPQVAAEVIRAYMELCDGSARQPV